MAAQVPTDDQTGSGESMDWWNPFLFTHDLPTRPCPQIGKVLVTGASGYVGGRLVNELLARGYQVRVMLRAPSPGHEQRWPRAEVVVADALDGEALKTALQGVHAAYYLIHSLMLGPKDFETADIQAARNFSLAAEANGLRHIIYLSGLGDAQALLSHHLQNRMDVGKTLLEGPTPVTVLRAAIIIGSGSASFEIIQHLVKRCPFLPIPKWANNKCQPIAIRDVIKYLVIALEVPEVRGRMLDIGGPEILTYLEMLKTFAALLRKKRFFPHLPFSSVRLYSYMASFLTPVPAPLVRCLMEGLKNDVVCQNESIRHMLPFKLLTYREALIGALSREEQDMVYTRWSDAYPRAHDLAIKLHELPEGPKYQTSCSLLTDKHASAMFHSICKIGGRHGWFNNNWMWRLRGMFDRLLMGVGTSRGRKSQSNIRIDDVVDFWRVEDIESPKRLLLRAEMKLPGKAWLEFAIDQTGGEREDLDEENGAKIGRDVAGRKDATNRLCVKAYYDTNTLWGRLYWYLFLPFHHFIFTHLIEDIEKRS